MADVVAELVGWESGVEFSIDELRNWCDDDLHDDGALIRCDAPRLRREVCFA